MSDTTDANGLDPNADAGQDPNVTTSTDGDGLDPKPTGFDALPEETQAEIKKLRRQNNDFRKRVEAFETANQTEDEKRTAALKAAEERATAAESRYRTAIGRAAVTEAASKAGALSTKAVYALIRDDIDFDDDGEPTNIAALIAAAKKDEPQLFRAAGGSGDGGRGGPPDTTTDMNAQMRKMLGYKARA